MNTRHAHAALLIALAAFGITANAAEPHDTACPEATAWIAAHKAEAARRKPVTAGDPALHDRIIAMAKEDQSWRERVIADHGRDKALVRQLIAADAKHLVALHGIAPDGRLPALTQVGSDGMKALLLLVQHADSDPAWQAAVLNNLPARMKAGDVDGQAIAYLTDRVLRDAGKPQRYGTQMDVVDGKLTAGAVEDPARLEARRSAIGMMPMRDYACVVAATYGMPLAIDGTAPAAAASPTRTPPR